MHLLYLAAFKTPFKEIKKNNLPFIREKKKKKLIK